VLADVPRGRCIQVDAPTDQTDVALDWLITTLNNPVKLPPF
jgi:hypothetical protein